MYKCGVKIKLNKLQKPLFCFIMAMSQFNIKRLIWYFSLKLNAEHFVLLINFFYVLNENTLFFAIC